MTGQNPPITELKCVGCGRPMKANPTRADIAKQGENDSKRCTTCIEVGDLFMILGGEA